MFGRKKKPKTPATTATAVMSGVPTDAVVHHLNPAAVMRELHAKAHGVGMQGYAPIVRVSKNRVRCTDGCGELVFPGVRHICLWNAHYHIESLTHAERDKLIADLRALGIADDGTVKRRARND